jgi:hypothetical protein
MKIEDRVQIEVDPLTGGAVLALYIPEVNKVIQYEICDGTTPSLEVAGRLKYVAAAIEKLTETGGNASGGALVARMMTTVRGGQ